MKSALLRWTGFVGLLALLLVAGTGVRVASASNCGGSTACKCGDTVTRSTTLSRDIGVCTGNGLRVISGVTLDCAKRTITGSTLSPAKYGVLVDGAKGATVKNCRVTGFRKGIRLAGGRETRSAATRSSRITTTDQRWPAARGEPIARNNVGTIETRASTSAGRSR